MRVRMKTIYAGPLGNYQPGDTAEFASKEGKALVAGGFADEIGKVERRIAVPVAPVVPTVPSSPVPETATPPAPETATPPAPETATPPVPEKTDL